jgi:membrane protein implicated in regulation of membrane protease activity
MESLLANASALWLIVGIAMVFVEVSLGMATVVLLFTGLAAITVGALILFGAIDSESGYVQLSVFFVLSIVWTAALWKPLKNWRSNSKASFSNMVGETGRVEGGDLAPGKKGSIRWSGTVMQAILAEGEAPVSEGQDVTIISIKGTVATVKKQ